MAYSLGVDLGTTYSAAAVARDGKVEVVTLGSTSPVIPSVVVLRADGDVLVGEAADRRSISEPTRTAREFKRRLGDPTPIVLGGTPYGAEALMAHLLRAIVTLVTDREGEAPTTVVLTHPANYGPFKLGLMEEAARLAGLDLSRVRYVTEPQAAAVSYARSQRVAPGELVAVYDFGGGTFDAAMVRRTDDGFELVGTPEGIDRLGGIDIDAAVLAHVNESVDGMLSELDTSDAGTRAALGRLRDECRAAKEALSSDTDTAVGVAVPGLQTEVRLTREELETMIRPRVAETVEALRRAIASCGVPIEQVSRVLLVGGTSRMPLVAQSVREMTGRPVAVDAHPKLAIASGAALLGEPDRDRAVPPPPPSQPAAVVTPAMPVTSAATSVSSAPAVAAKRKSSRRTVPIVVGSLAGIAAGIAAVVVLTGGDDVPESDAVTTIASSGGSTGSSGEPGSTVAPGGVVTVIALSRPENVAVSSNGAVFATDGDTQQVAEVSSGSQSILYAGDAGAGESNTFGVAVAPDDSVWFSNGNGVFKLEGSSAAPVLTDEFVLGNQFGLGFDRTGNLYVAETGGNRLLRLDLRGELSVVAGTGESTTQDGGIGDGGQATDAQLGEPVAVAIDADGNVYVAESFTRRVRRITPDGTITTFAGGGSVDLAAAADGTPASDVRFASVAGLAVDSDGNVYVSDSESAMVVRFDRSGALTRLMPEEPLSEPKGLWIDQQGNLWFVDGQAIRRTDDPG